jgi:hypothetical protein
MNKRRFLSSRLARALGLVTTARSTTGSDTPDPAATRRTIDASVDEALTERSSRPWHGAHGRMPRK